MTGQRSACIRSLVTRIAAFVTAVFSVACMGPPLAGHAISERPLGSAESDLVDAGFEERAARDTAQLLIGIALLVKRGIQRASDVVVAE